MKSSIIYISIIRYQYSITIYLDDICVKTCESSCKYKYLIFVTCKCSRVKTNLLLKYILLSVLYIKSFSEINGSETKTKTKKSQTRKMEFPCTDRCCPDLNQLINCWFKHILLNNLNYTNG